jgi:choline kinase
MKAIILAAGYGRRLAEVSGGLPKSMIKIDSISIMHRQIQACLRVGIKNFVFVLGYRAEELISHILEILSNEQCNFVINEKFRSTNTLYSLWLTRDYLDEDFLYFNADILFIDQLLDKIVVASEESLLLLEESRCAEEEVKMILDQNYYLKEIGKKLDPKDCAGEFIGIGRFSKNILKLFVEKLQYGVDNSQENNYFEYAVDLLCKEVPIKAISTDNLPCIEIDFPEDLKRAEEEILPKFKNF